MRFPTYKEETKCANQGYDLVIGCDEVGVSPLAGPVVAAACVLNPNSIGKYRSKNKWYYRVRDSKTTTEPERQVLKAEILKHTLFYGLGVVSEKEIDQINIHQASLRAMQLATEEIFRKILSSKLDKLPKKIILFVDGRFTVTKCNPPGFGLEQKCIVKGDAKILSIAAASIIAKVHRDNLMHKLHKKFPAYGFAKHKGYGTLEHQRIIANLGPTPAHRKSFLKKFSNT